MKKAIITSVAFLIVIFMVAWWRAPLFYHEMNKQTVYVGVIDAWHGGSHDDEAHALWIDDDSGEGVFAVKRIADSMGITPCFAVIADKMAPVVADSLASWQRQGAADIALHGLCHDHWKEWSEEQIANDLHRSILRIHELGFDTTRILRMVIPPHGCNTRAIRRVICQQGFQMVTGASLVNPDRHVFQLGRIAITPGTDMDDLHQLLQKAHEGKMFVIFGTHSSNPAQFSEEKTKEVLETARKIGFKFVFYE